MKQVTKFFFLGLVLLISNSLSAQFGIRGGAMFSNIGQGNVADNFEKYKNNFALGGMVGIMGDLPAGSILAFSPELYFIQKGGQIKYTILNTDYKTRIINNYIEANVLVKLRFGNVDRQGAGFHIAAGPYAGFALSGKYVTEFGDTKNEVDIEYGDRQDEQDRMDYGLLFGVGVDFGSLTIDARWHQGLKNLSNNETTDGIFSDEYRNVGLSLSLGYYFNL